VELTVIEIEIQNEIIIQQFIYLLYNSILENKPLVTSDWLFTDGVNY
jgi:hypothetical protein